MGIKDFPGGQELITINTERVYDWIVTESNFDLTLVNEALPAGLAYGDFDPDAVTVEVAPPEVEPIEILSREERRFTVGNTEMDLHVINIRRNFIATLSFPTAVGVEELVIPFSRNEQVVLYAPDDTVIELMYTDIDSYVTSIDVDPGDTVVGPTFDAVISIRVCQSIQAVYPVTLEILADFSEPRDLLPVQPCPAPAMPPESPAVFPFVSRAATVAKTNVEPQRRRVQGE